MNFTCALEVKDGSLLGDIPVYHYKDMPKTPDENGLPRTDIFVFRTVHYSLKKYFDEGQIVELIIPD
jgi:hypothetical protein